MMALTQKEDTDDYQTTPTKNSEVSGSKRGLPRVRSGSSMAALLEEQRKGDLKQKED